MTVATLVERGPRELHDAAADLGHLTQGASPTLPRIREPRGETAGRDRGRADPAAPRRLPLGRTADPLAETLGRLFSGRRAAATADPAVVALAQRLDDKGCASGRVTAARLEELSRAFDRLEAKLNAILIAVTATFVSTLLGLVVYVLRTAVQPGVVAP